MTLRLLTSLAYVAHVTGVVKGTIVYPIIVNERTESGTKAKLVITPTHSLEMENVSILGHTYIERMEIDGNPVDLLLDSSIVQKNMYQCRQNMATYSVKFHGGSMYVDGIVNTSHVIRPIKQRTKRVRRIPHKLFSIAKTLSGTRGKSIEAQFLRNSRARRLRKQRKGHLRNDTARPQGHRPEERDGSSNTAQKNAFPHHLAFAVEIFCVVDRTLYDILTKDGRSVTRYLAEVLNIVKLKIENQDLYRMTVRLTGLHVLSLEEEVEVVVKKGKDMDIDETLINLAKYALRTTVMRNADAVFLFTGRVGYSYKGGRTRHLMGLTFTGKVCDPHWKVGIVEDLGGVYQASITLPHELGHLLGSPHDGPENKAYPFCPEQGAIMAPIIDGNSGDIYSGCSLMSIHDLFQSMSDKAYLDCIAIKDPTDLLKMEQHLPPPNFTAEQFCMATEGAQYYSTTYKDCVFYCYYGNLWKGYPYHDYPAPYGYRCGKGMICLYGTCVSCHKYQPEWPNCDNY